jgi:hypothetical protein
MLDPVLGPAAAGKLIRRVRVGGWPSVENKICGRGCGAPVLQKNTLTRSGRGSLLLSSSMTCFAKKSLPISSLHFASNILPAPKRKETKSVHFIFAFNCHFASN